MNKKIINKIIYMLPILLILLSLVVYGATKSSRVSSIYNNIGKVYAEDEDEDEEDEDEDHEDEDEDHEDDDDYNEEEEVVYETQYVEQNVTNVPPIEEVPIIRYITVIDPGFHTDVDGDGLMDAIDPNPTVPEMDFFTDDDKDGVPNAADARKGEDDFLFVDFEDLNANGILDSLEYTAQL